MAGKINLDLGQWNLALDKAYSELKQKDSLLKRAFLMAGLKDLKDHFDKEEGPDGKWKARKPETNDAYERIRKGFRKPAEGVARAAYRASNKILQLSGSLRKQSVLNPEITMLDSTTLRVQSQSRYGAAHDEGGVMPKREFMYMSDKAQDNMGMVILKALAAGFE